MKKNVLAAFLFFVGALLFEPVCAAEGAHRVSGTVVEEEGVYIGSLPNKPDLTFVMGPVTSENQEKWKRYADNQQAGYTPPEAKHTNDGSAHFAKVMKGGGERWVAYITTKEDPDFNYPDYEKMLIYVSVSSSPSPDVLITSHMGISRTVESYFREKKYRGLSMDLHSFAARVMLMRNTKREFMVTVPAWVMANIMIKHLPDGSVFVGRKKRIEELMSRRNATFQDLEKDDAQDAQTILAELKDKIDFHGLNRKEKRKLKRHLDNFNAMLNGDGQEYTLEEFAEDEDAQEYIYFDGAQFVANEGLGSLIPESKKAKLEQNALELYKEGGWEHIATKNLKLSSMDELFQFFEKHPPLIDYERGDFENKILIYDPLNRERTKYSISSSDRDYSWLFNATFRPQGSTKYTVTDLNALADFSF